MKRFVFGLTLVFALVGFGIANANIGMQGLGFIAPQVGDKANVYSPQTGEIVYDSSDSGFYGYNQAGAWVSLNAAAADNTPAGVIMPFAGASAPSGYMLANGAAVSRTVYSVLFGVIGTTYGAGDGSTTFNLPNLSGVFIRGAGSQVIGGQTFSGSIGVKQVDAFESHSHVQNYGNTGGGGIGTNGFFNYNGVSAATGMSTGATGGGETNPANISLNHIIKY